MRGLVRQSADSGSGLELVSKVTFNIMSRPQMNVNCVEVTGLSKKEARLLQKAARSRFNVRLPARVLSYDGPRVKVQLSGASSTLPEVVQILDALDEALSGSPPKLDARHNTVFRNLLDAWYTRTLKPNGTESLKYGRRRAGYAFVKDILESNRSGLISNSPEMVNRLLRGLQGKLDNNKTTWTINRDQHRFLCNVIDKWLDERRVRLFTEKDQTSVIRRPRKSSRAGGPTPNREVRSPLPQIVLNGRLSNIPLNYSLFMGIFSGIRPIAPDQRHRKASLVPGRAGKLPGSTPPLSRTVSLGMHDGLNRIKDRYVSAYAKSAGDISRISGPSTYSRDNLHNGHTRTPIDPADADALEGYDEDYYLGLTNDTDMDWRWTRRKFASIKPDLPLASFGSVSDSPPNKVYYSSKVFPPQSSVVEAITISPDSLSEASVFSEDSLEPPTMDRAYLSAEYPSTTYLSAISFPMAPKEGDFSSENSMAKTPGQGRYTSTIDCMTSGVPMGAGRTSKSSPVESPQMEEHVVRNYLSPGVSQEEQQHGEREKYEIPKGEEMSSEKHIADDLYVIRKSSAENRKSSAENRKSSAEKRGEVFSRSSMRSGRVEDVLAAYEHLNVGWRVGETETNLGETKILLREGDKTNSYSVPVYLEVISKGQVSTKYVESVLKIKQPTESYAIYLVDTNRSDVVFEEPMKGADVRADLVTIK